MKIYKIYDTDGHVYYSDDPWTILEQFGTCGMIEEYELMFTRDVTDIINGEMLHEL